jgi:hypothetical protein
MTIREVAHHLDDGWDGPDAGGAPERAAGVLRRDDLERPL